MRRCLYLILLAFTTACGDKERGVEPPAPCPAIIGISVRPASATLAVGDTVQLIARLLTYQGNPCRAVELDGPFEWAVSDSAVARVYADSGTVVAKLAGQAIVTASWRENRNYRAGAEISVVR